MDNGSDAITVWERQDGANQIDWGKIAGSPGSYTFAAETPVAYTLALGSAAGRQPDSETSLEHQNNARHIATAPLRKGDYTYLNFSLTLNGTDVGVRIIKVHDATGVVQYVKDFGVTGSDVIYSSLAVNDTGELALGFTLTGPNAGEYAGAWFATGHDSGSAIAFNAPSKAAGGVSTFRPGAGRNRWGDYTATVNDPSNNRRFWTFQQWVSATDVDSIQVTSFSMTPATTRIRRPASELSTTIARG